MTAQKAIGAIALWLARISALLLFLFWGAFFVEHLLEWFLRPDGVLPPASVWVGQLLHFAMLVGLGMIVLFPGWGAVVTAITTASFFSWIGYKGFPYIALLNLPPIVFAATYAVMNTMGSTEGGARRPAEHRFLKFILPAKAFEAVKTGTKQWLAECPCGHNRDVWDSGGVRYLAAGEPRQLGRCPACGKATMHKIRRKTAAERREIP